MDDICRDSAGRAAMLALALSVAITAATPARAADGIPASDLTASTESDPTRATASGLLIATRDAAGPPGADLPLEITLVRAPNVSIEAIKLLGLPHGVTISDTTNIFAASIDHADVDVSDWDLSKIRIMQSDPRAGSFSIAVAAIWTPESGGHLDVTSSRLTVRFAPDRPDPAGGKPGPDERRADPSDEANLAPRMPAAAVAAGQDAPAAEVVARETAAGTAPASPAKADRPASPAIAAQVPAQVPAQALARAGATAPDPLVERARGLIRLGDISGARLLLERAQARGAPNATFLLAQTWDPAMLRAWKVRGLRPDPDRARSLYAKAAGQDRAEERRLAAKGH
ncbi:hypothetical protein [Methylobacterium sp. P5_C11]